MNSEKPDPLMSDAAAGSNFPEPAQNKIPTDLFAKASKLAKSDEPAVRIEPTFGALSELPANDSHGRAVERFQQAKLALPDASTPAGSPPVWQNKPPQRSWIFSLLKRWAKPFLKIQRVPEKLDAAPFDIEKPVLL